MSNFSQPVADIADQYLGNIKEDRDLASQLALDQKQQRCLEVTIDREDCCKGRIFAQVKGPESEAADSPVKQTLGMTVGIVKGRDWSLRDGDVLMTQSQRRVLVSIQRQQVIALQFDRKVYNSPVKLMQLGHVMGNQHWPIAVQGETLYVQPTDDAERIEATIKEIVNSLEISGLYIVREFKEAEQAIAFSHGYTQGHTHAHSTHAH